MNDLLRVAYAHFEAKRFDKAKTVASQVLAKNPGTAKALYLLGCVEAEKNNFQQAAMLLSRALERQPTSALNILRLAVIYRDDLQQYDDALPLFLRLNELHPNEPAYMLDIGLLLFQKAELTFGRKPGKETPEEIRKLLAGALEWLDRALAINPRSSYAQKIKVLSHVALNQIYPALVAGLGYMDLEPNDMDFKDIFRDMQLRMRLEKTLRESSASGNATLNVSPEFLAPRPPDAWDTKAIAEISRTIGEPITGTAAVFFHVEVHDKHPFLNSNPSEEKKKIDYLAALSISCRCARLTQPGVKIILLTDERTDLGTFADADHVIRLPRDEMHLMYARVRACRALALAGLLRGPVLFLDTDICLNRDFSPLFDGTFDIGLTYRSLVHFPLMPVNEGVVIASPHRAGALAHFFEVYLRLYDWLVEQPGVKDRYTFDVRFWRGGQISLTAFAGWRVPPSTGDLVERNTLHCRFFNCEEYNYSVQPETPLESLGDLWALHFKGALPKAMMSQYLALLENGNAKRRA